MGRDSLADAIALALVLALGVGCSPSRSGSRGDGRDAATGIDHYGILEAGSDGAWGADVDGGANPDAEWMPGCTSGSHVGALGPPEAVATARQEPSYVGASNDGPVWTEASYFVDSNGVMERGAAVAWLPPANASPQFSFVDDLCGEKVAELHVYADHMGVILWPMKTSCGSPLLVWSRIDGSLRTQFGALPPLALDDSHIYLGDTPCVLRRAPLESDAGAVAPEEEPGACGQVAVDGSTIYVFNTESSPRYRVQRIANWGDAPEVLADDVVGPASHMGFQADNGAVFWHVDKTSTLYELPAGSSTPRILLDDPDGVWGFTVDHEYVYWASGEGWKAAQGTVKRIRHCGGTPEVIAHGQRWSAGYRDPVGISVGDRALYWVTGDGNIMRIRKLDAPAAGGSTVNDAGADGSVDASADATPDTSLDAGAD